MIQWRAMKICILFLTICSISSAKKVYSNQDYTTPVPILKQIDRHNDDGSYSYGYEAADGTYKIETKYPTGEVFGKYGYIDDLGKIREVEYGASKRGFEAAGTDVTVAPPTLTHNPAAQRPLAPNEEDDGQYREDPAVYYQNDPEFIPKPKSVYTQPSYQAPQQQTYTKPTYSLTPQTYNPPAPQPVYTDYNTNHINNNNNYYQPQPKYNPPPPPPLPVPQYNPPPVQQYNPPQYNPQPQRSYWNPSPPAHPGYNPFNGAPAQNVDIWTGSYTVNYR